MKKANILLVAVCAFLVTITSSCLSSDNNNSYDAFEYMTVEGSYPLYEVYGESGTTYIVSNQSELILKQNNGENYNYNRAFMFFKYEDDNTEANTRKISVVAVRPLYESNVSFKKDTLQLTEDNEIDNSKYQPFMRGNWVSYNRGYLTVHFNFFPQEKITLKNFVLVVDKVDGNSLNLRLVNTMNRDDNGYATNSYPTEVSYLLNINELRHEHPDIDINKDIQVSVFLDTMNDGVTLVGEKPIDIKLSGFEI